MCPGWVNRIDAAGTLRVDVRRRARARGRARAIAIDEGRRHLRAVARSAPKIYSVSRIAALCFSELNILYSYCTQYCEPSAPRNCISFQYLFQYPGWHRPAAMLTMALLLPGVVLGR